MNYLIIVNILQQALRKCSNGFLTDKLFGFFKTFDLFDASINILAPTSKHTAQRIGILSFHCILKCIHKTNMCQYLNICRRKKLACCIVATLTYTIPSWPQHQLETQPKTQHLQETITFIEGYFLSESELVKR